MSDRGRSRYRAFLDNPKGAIQVGGRTIRIRGLPARGERIRDKVEDAYARKYTTPSARKYVRGFRTLRRREATIEIVPPAPRRVLRNARD